MLHFLLETENDNTLDDVHENFKKELTLVEIYAEREKSINESKAAIAGACEDILQDPEANVSDMFLVLVE